MHRALVLCVLIWLVSTTCGTSRAETLRASEPALGAQSPKEAEVTVEPHFVAESSDLRRIEDEVIDTPLIELAGTDLQITDDDDIESAFFKARAAYALYAREHDLPAEIVKRGKFGKDCLAISARAHERWPQSVDLAVMHAYAVLYANGAETALEKIAPWVHDAARVPGVAIVLHRIFHTIDLNLKLGTMQPETSVLVKLGIDPNEVKIAAEDLAILWATYIDVKAAGRLASSSAAYKYEGMRFETVERQWRAIRYWQTILRHLLGKEHLREYQRAEKAKIDEQNRRYQQEYVERQDKVAADREQAFKRDVEKLIERAKTKPDWQALEQEISNFVGSHKSRLLKEYPHLPELTSFQSIWPDGPTATISDVWYRLLVFRDPKATLQEAAQVKHAGDNIWLAYIKAMAHLELKQSAEAEAILLSIIAADAQQYRAKHMLLHVEQNQKAASQVSHDDKGEAKNKE